MNSTLLSTVLTSSFIAGVVSVVCAGAFNLLSQHQQYKNDYYKQVISKRMAAYEVVERLIVMIKTSVLDESGDRRLYHWVFSFDPSDISLQVLLTELMSRAFWISDKAFRKTQELNKILFVIPSDGPGRIEFGKKYYKRIAIIRDELEIIVANDSLHLHDVDAFLKSKIGKKSGFVPFDPHSS